MNFSAETQVRVRYSETDQMGIVYHANYLVWFEVGRTELFRGINLPYTKFEEQGVSLAVIEASCRYRKPARYDDELLIITKIDHLSARGASFSYSVYREDSLLAEGKTKHVFINRDGRPTDIKRYEIWELLQPILGKLKEINSSS